MASEEEQFNALISELRILETTYNDQTVRLNILDRVLTDARLALETVRGLESENEGEVLLQAGAGVLLKGAPPKSDRVLINIGANVMMEKSREDAAGILETRIKGFEENLLALAGQRNQVAQRIEADRRVIQAIASRQAKQQ